MLEQRKHAEAEPLLRKALASCQKNLGENHFITSACYQKLASDLEAQGKLGEAERLCAWR